MKVFRIGKTKFSKDLTGEGAKLHGGRWNHVSIPCIYCSENRALAVLEYTVNVNIDDIPRTLSITTFEIPDKGIFEIVSASLPGNWKEAPAPASTKDFGSSLLKDLKYPVLKIPSAVIEKEFNYILNPLTPLSGNFKILEVVDFIYDVRIKLV